MHFCFQDERPPGPTIANGCTVESANRGYGHLIGSRGGPAARVRLCPKSFTNKGETVLDQGSN
ncbi:MAG: hypothetical protein CV089_21410 [Nitrospira sp. WS110]|nr:hypothetical protein [Nitrospira sp. WS110]